MAKLVKSVAKMAVVIMALSLLALLRIFSMMAWTAPVVSTTPANARAIRIRATVSSMLERPPRLTRRLISATPVSMLTPVYMEARMVARLAFWKMAAKMPPRAETPIRPGMAGTLKMTMSRTHSGGMNITGLMVKNSLSVPM